VKVESTSEILVWLTGAGSIALVGWFVSWLLDDLAWWQSLPSQAKQAAILGMALVIGLLATWLLSRPDLVAALDAYVKTAMAAIVAWLSTQVAYNVKKKARQQ
jgi:hypothetical protein